MGFMAGFGSAFAESYDKQKDREFQHQEDDFKLQMEAYMRRQDQLLQTDRENYKAVQTAKAAAHALGHDEYWPTLFPAAKGGADLTSLITMGQNTTWSNGPKTNSSSGSPADNSQNLTHQAQSATDAQMQQSGMTPPPSGGVFSTNPPPPNTGQDQAAQHLRETPDTSNNQNAPTAPMGATGSNSNPVQTIGSSGPQAPSLPQTAPAPTPSPQDPVTAQQNRPTNTGAQDNNPVPPMPVPGVKNQAQGAPPPPQPDQSFNPPGGNIPPPNLSAVPSRPGEFPVDNFPGSQANRQRVMQDVGGQDQYNKVMGSNLITGSPIPGLDNVQVNMQPRGVMRPQDVKNLADAQAYYNGVIRNPALKDEIPQAKSLLNQYMNQKTDEAILAGTYQAPTRAAVLDDNGQGTGAYARPIMEGAHISRDADGSEVWVNPNTHQRIPTKNLLVFDKPIEDQITADSKTMGPLKDAYSQDKASFFDMLGTMGNMQRLATQYPAAMGKSGDFAQAVTNAKRETFNILSLLHPGLDPEKAPDPNSPIDVNPGTLGTLEGYERKLWSNLGSVNQNTDKTAIAASLLDAQAIRLAYMQAMSMNENAGPNGKRVSQAQFEGIYKAIRSGEKPESLGRSNADFLVSKYNNLKVREAQFNQAGSPTVDFKNRFNVPSPLSYGTGIDQDLQGNKQAQDDFNYFRNLPDVPISGTPAPTIMDQTRHALGLPPSAPQQTGNQEAGPNHTVGNSKLPPDIPQGSKVLGLTKDGSKIVYQTPDGKQVISDH